MNAPPRLILPLILLLPACAGSEKAMSAWDSGYAGAEDGAWDTGYGPEGGDGYGEESEDDFPMLSPVATPYYVFIANPDRDTVTRIAVPSLEMVTVEVGHVPQVLAATSDGKAVTFNVGSDDVSVIDAETLEVESVSVRSNCNAMEVSPDGRWAFVYHDADVDDPEAEDRGGAQSFNEASLVDLDELVEFPMVVGTNPRQVRFTEDGGLLLVLSDESLAVVSLTDDEHEPVPVALSDDPLDVPQAEELAVAPDGSYAFVRQFQATEVLVVDLGSLELGRVPVGANPTDLDLTPDGRWAVVVARASKELWLLPTEDPFDVAEQEVIPMPEDEVLGSVELSPDGRLGILYTTAARTTHYGVWDVATGEITVRSFVKPVQSLSISPDGGTLLVFHTYENADDADPDDPYNDAWAFTLLDLDDFRSNPLRLAGEPSEFAHAEDGSHGYFIMDGQPYLEVLDYGSLIREDVELKSLPTHVGTLPGTSLAYASQEHPLGRISFYDAEDGSLTTITGFELNSEIEH